MGRGRGDLAPTLGGCVALRDGGNLSLSMRAINRINPRPVYKPHSVRRAMKVYTLVCGAHPASSLRPPTWAIISLGRRSPAASCSLPGTQMRRAASRSCLALLLMGVAWPQTLLPAPVVSYTMKMQGIPENGLHSLDICRQTRFACKRPPFHPYRQLPAVCFCGPDPAGFPAPGVTRHHALWSADFPRPGRSPAAIARPTWGSP